MENVSKEQLLHACKMSLASIYAQRAICFQSGTPLPAQEVVDITADQLETLIEAAEGKEVDPVELLTWAMAEVTRLDMED